MAVQLDGGGKEDLKTQFVTREGTYKLMTLSEYSRPNRVGYTNSQGSASVRVSFVTLPDPADPTGAQGLGDRMCFNFGKELYVYVYRGVKKVRRDPAAAPTMTRDAPGAHPDREPSSRPNLARPPSLRLLARLPRPPRRRTRRRELSLRSTCRIVVVFSSFAPPPPFFIRQRASWQRTLALTFLRSIPCNHINTKD